MEEDQAKYLEMIFYIFNNVEEDIEEIDIHDLLNRIYLGEVMTKEEMEILEKLFLKYAI